MELPVKMVNRAKALWLEPGEGGKKRTFAEVAALLNNEFNSDVTRQTVQKWQKNFGWTVGATEALQQQALDVAMTAAPAALTLPDRDPDEDQSWEWEKRKMKFLTTLAGVAEDCFTVARQPDADGIRLSFRDAESALKTGMAAMELLGKINSGKHDDVTAGDRIPTLSEDAVAGVVNFFINVNAPVPDVKPVPLTIDAEAESADSN